MSPAAAVTTGLALALVIAGAWAAWIWKTRLARLETAEGLSILSGMRWRELSNLVVDALAGSGFERESAEQQARRGAAGDVLVYRDGHPWLLTCRQGLTHRVTRESVAEFARSLRVEHAVGGLIVTPGRVDSSARVVAANVELVDGDELWRLVGPMLPTSVHAEIATRARARALRATGGAVAVATIAGVALALLLLQFDGGAPDDPSAAIASTPTSRPGPAASRTASPAPAAPMSEDEEREAIVHEMSQLPGVDKALWSTRSTLQVFLNDPAVASDTVLCAVMKRHELLRASRLQLQSPAGSARPVRFMQCAVY